MRVVHRPFVLAIVCASLAIVLANPAAAQIGAAGIEGVWEGYGETMEF